MRGLVERIYGGNVRKAAGAIGIAHTTLLNLMSEEKDISPSAAVLRKIAERFATSEEWLQTGRGDAPTKMVLQAGKGGVWEPAVIVDFPYSAWWDVVSDLELPEAYASWLRELPRRTEKAAYSFARLGDLPTNDEPNKPAWPPLQQAMRREASAWTALFNGWIEYAGLPAVRAAILTNPPRVVAMLAGPVAGQEGKILSELSAVADQTKIAPTKTKKAPAKTTRRPRSK